MFQKCHVCSLLFHFQALPCLSLDILSHFFILQDSASHFALPKGTNHAPRLGWIPCMYFHCILCRHYCLYTKRNKTEGLPCPVLHFDKISEPDLKLKTSGSHHYFKIASHMLNFTSIIMGLSGFMWLHSSIPLHIPHA